MKIFRSISLKDKEGGIGKKAYSISENIKKKEEKDNLLLYVDKSLLKFQVLLNI